MTTIAAMNIGTGGTMFIDDDGTNIRFYLSQTDPATNIGGSGKPWAATVNDTNIGGNFTWPSGGGTRLIAGPYAAGYSQTVAFVIGATGTSGFGNGGTIRGSVSRSTVPNAPTPVTYSNVTHNSMSLAWTLAGNGGAAIDQILLRRSLTSDFASYTDIPLAANATSYNATGLATDTLYYWRVFAHNARGFSPPSGTTSRRTAGRPDTPEVPTASNITANTVMISWKIPANGGMPITAMILQRSTKADFSANLVTTEVPATATATNVGGLTPGTTYYWRVIARNVAGDSGPSGARQATTLGAQTPTLSMTRTDTTSSAVLTLPGGSTGFSKYTLQRRIVGQSTITSTDSTTSPIATTGLSATTRYEWRASAWYGTYQTGWTDWVSTPAAPTTPTASEVTPTSMRLTWVRPTDTGGTVLTQMILRYSTDQAFGSYTDVPLASSATTTVVTGLTAGTVYYWQVLARNSVGYSVPSATRSQATLPGGAPGLTVTAAVSGTSSSAAISPPGGATGFTKYTLQRRIVGQTTVTTLESATSPITSTPLVPGTRYEYRASAWFGTYQSPWTNWVALTQPNPNTDPGAYFDGNTTNTSVTSYTWTGTANNSTTDATSLTPTGWATFAESVGSTGATGAVFRAAGGARGSYCARAVFFTDATAAGFVFGTGSGSATAAVGENVEYVGSLYVWPSKSQRLRAVITWYTSGGTAIRSSYGAIEVVASGAWRRLTVTAISPLNARQARVRVQDVTGTGHSLWQGGDWLQADAAMLSVQTLYPYFDGSTTDTAIFNYEWEGATHASPSLRREIEQAELDPLIDPDCPPVPVAPEPPSIVTSCIDDTDTWRRYWAVIPEEEVYDWLAVVPTLTITTGTVAARQVRIRFYQNPDNLPPIDAMGLEFESEQVITYMPSRTVITLDGVSESVWASVNGADEVPADHLLSGTDGAPPSWPVLSCGSAYLVSFDVPLDAPEGNVVIGAALTTRMM